MNNVKISDDMFGARQYLKMLYGVRHGEWYLKASKVYEPPEQIHCLYSNGKIVHMFDDNVTDEQRVFYSIKYGVPLLPTSIYAHHRDVYISNKESFPT